VSCKTIKRSYNLKKNVPFRSVREINLNTNTKFWLLCTSENNQLSGSTAPLAQKPSNGQDPELVPSTFRPHNTSLRAILMLASHFLLSLPSGRFPRHLPTKNSVCILCQNSTPSQSHAQPIVASCSTSLTTGSLRQYRQRGKGEVVPML
jgi:hypothetical protein